MKIPVLLLVLSALFSQLTLANNNLTRTAFLGLAPVSPAAGDKVQVAGLHPKGTGAAIGLAEGDILLKVNNQEVADFPQLVSLLAKTVEGSPLSLSVKRQDNTLTLTGVAQSRPKEQGDGYQSRYGEFKWQGNHIRTIEYLPDNPRKDQAGVFFIQGYTCDSIDYGMAPNITINQLLASYAQAGFRVFKMEKPGVGDSTGPLTCTEYDFDTENAAFIAGLKHFANKPEINADNVFVFGHSLGVLHAAIIAEKGLAKGVMGYGGVLKSWYQYLQDIYSKQATEYFQVSASQSAENLKRVKPFLDQWLNTDKKWQQIIAEPANQQALQSNLLPINGEQIFDRHYGFFRSVNRHDFSALWSNSQAHALLMHGNLDIQAIEPDWANDIATLVNKHTPYQAKALFFAGTEHSLMQYPSLEALQTAMNNRSFNPGQPGEHYNGEIAQASLQWMQAILADQPIKLASRQALL